MGSGVLAFVESRGGELKKSGAEVVAQAKRLADQLGGSVNAAVIVSWIRIIVSKLIGIGCVDRPGQMVVGKVDVSI